MSLVVVQALIMLAEVNGAVPSFNLNDIKNHISHQDLERLKSSLIISTHRKQNSSPEICRKFSPTPADYYSKVASSLRVAFDRVDIRQRGPDHR